ncbi:DUF1697 domain-containing protein [Pseudooceanicola sp. LIPI14-2-Ac024]|uniref:DUF1697 domain-containing protein n=1 Tax=Pseudooceanicola sp. LIPI14-2-Ac024 TaxID=3344875 RepID=UPI0035CF107B
MRWIVLLRAVNVGGTGKLPMAELRKALAAAGAEDVATYIQSGNVVMSLDEDDPRRVEAMVAQVIEDNFGFRPGVMAFTAADFDAALGALPAEPEYGRHLHLMFFTDTPDPEVAAKLAGHCTGGETVVLGERCLYLHAPAGFGTSKLGGRVERALGVAATGRNLNSVRKIRAMV